MSKRSLSILAIVFVTACSSGQVGQMPASTSVPVTASKLQLAVGVATLGGGASTEYGLNVVETFRNASGLSAVTTDTPTLSGPAGAFGAPTITAVTGLTLPQQASIGAQVAAGNQTPAAPFPGSSSDLFGNVTGAFGYGFAPDNLADPQSSSEISEISGCLGFTANDSARYAVATVPQSATDGGVVCDNSSNAPGLTPTQFYGGPPLWPSPAGYGLPIGFAGYTSGFSIFVPCADDVCTTPAKPIAGAYGLSVAVPTGGSNPNTYTAIAASANLAGSQVSAPLPAVSPPSVQVQSDGTGLVNVTVPVDPRIVETIVYVAVPDCGLGFVAPAGSEPIHYYSLITKTFGPQTLLLSNLGPPGANGQPTHTFCNAADAQALAGLTASIPTFGLSATAVAFDYPAYEASYPANRSQTPAIANPTSGTSDLSISPTTACSSYTPPPSGGSAPCPQT